MTILNTRGARVIDPVLTGVAQGYRHAQRVGHMLFPAVDVPARGGQVIEFGKESFRHYATKRAPGASVGRVQFGYKGKPFALSQQALDAVVPREHMDDAAVVPGIDLSRRSVSNVMDVLTLSLEIEQALIARNTANYAAENKTALVGAARWTGANSTPIADVELAKKKIRTSCGLNPNTMVIGSDVFSALKGHPTIVDRFKYVSAESITSKMLAGLFELEDLAVGTAAYINGPDDNSPFVEAWGLDAVLAYVPKTDMGMEQPSYGYTYTLKGHPFVEQERWDGDTRSFLYGVTYEREPVLTGIASGFLWQNAGAAAA
ncbi:major capsid protein [Pararhizobium gei]|uniref:major capsid protein n=1 Tax=Pararhizobium gei TaxID=1395951 RepID=UPI0023DC04FA|nr:major capsid protein [Rhizobium gei]